MVAPGLPHLDTSHSALLTWVHLTALESALDRNGSCRQLCLGVGSPRPTRNSSLGSTKERVCQHPTPSPGDQPSLWKSTSLRDGLLSLSTACLKRMRCGCWKPMTSTPLALTPLNGSHTGMCVALFPVLVSQSSFCPKPPTFSISN